MNVSHWNGTLHVKMTKQLPVIKLSFWGKQQEEVWSCMISKCFVSILDFLTFIKPSGWLIIMIIFLHLCVLRGRYRDSGRTWSHSIEVRRHTFMQRFICYQERFFLIGPLSLTLKSCILNKNDLPTSTYFSEAKLVSKGILDFNYKWYNLLNSFDFLLYFCLALQMNACMIVL